jgi:hypothetical protein
MSTSIRPLRSTALLALLALAAAGSAWAQRPAHANPAPLAPVAYTPRIDAEQAEHARRIHWGLASGRLTPHEARVLQRQQQRIQRTEARAKADGQVSPQERATLRRMLGDAEHDIRRQLRDEDRGPRRGTHHAGPGWR